MKKRIISGLLAITITAAALAGCGAKATDTAPATDASTATEEYYEAPSDSAAEYAAPAAEAEYSEEAADSFNYSSEVNGAAEQSLRASSAADAKGKVSTESEAAWYDQGYDEYYNEPDASGETYDEIEEEGFNNVLRNPLSTFGADVDTASYSNMRRLVNEGFDLYNFPAGSIRAEELINYFKYDYDAPKNGDRFGVNATVSECPWNRNSKLMILGVNTKELKESKRPDSNIVFLLDISGSMKNRDKLPLLKDALEILVEDLGKNDRVSIVTYASGTDVVLDGVRGNDQRKILNAFDSLQAGGSTNGEGGIELAYKIAEENFIEGGNNRVILGTDGDFNVGKCSGDELKELISEKKDSGIFLSVLGFGMGNYNDVTAETLADAGNGNYSYIDSITEAEKVLGEEMNSTLYTVAKDTKFQVEFNPAMVSSYRLIGYENRALNAEDFKDDTKDGGEVGAGHQVTVVYEIKLAEEDGEKGDLKYQDSVVSAKGKKGDEWCTLSIAYKDPDKDSSEYLEFPIGADNYTTKPSDDFIFATSVAEYAMALNDSSYLKDLSREEALEQAIRNVKMIDPDDKYREEFLELMERVAGNNVTTYGDAWYE